MDRRAAQSPLRFPGIATGWLLRAPNRWRTVKSGYERVPGSWDKYKYRKYIAKPTAAPASWTHASECLPVHTSTALSLRSSGSSRSGSSGCRADISGPRRREAWWELRGGAGPTRVRSQ